MINVLLVDDHELVRTGIRRLLDDARGIQVIGEAKSGEEALTLARRTRPDVVLMDVSMPGIGGLEATRKLLQIYPDLKVIIVTVHSDDPFPTHLMRAGAAGYLTKGCNPEEMITAIHKVFEGKIYINPDIAQQMAISASSSGKESPFLQLSSREMQVMLMLMQGQKSQEISEQLHLSPKTISTYRNRLFEKLGVKNDAELTRLAMRHGMFEGVS